MWHKAISVLKGEHKNDNQKKNKNRTITTTVNIQ